MALSSHFEKIWSIVQREHKICYFFVKTKLYMLFFDLLLFHETKLHWIFEINYFFRSTTEKFRENENIDSFASLLLSWKQNYACTVWKSRQKYDHIFHVKMSTFSVKSKLLKSWFHGKFLRVIALYSPFPHWHAHVIILLLASAKIP